MRDSNVAGARRGIAKCGGGEIGRTDRLTWIQDKRKEIRDNLT